MNWRESQHGLIKPSDALSKDFESSLMANKNKFDLSNVTPTTALLIRSSCTSSSTNSKKHDFIMQVLSSGKFSCDILILPEIPIYESGESQHENEIHLQFKNQLLHPCGHDTIILLPSYFTHTVRNSSRRSFGSPNSNKNLLISVSSCHLELNTDRNVEKSTDFNNIQNGIWIPSIPSTFVVGMRNYNKHVSKAKKNSDDIITLDIEFHTPENLFEGDRDSMPPISTSETIHGNSIVQSNFHQTIEKNDNIIGKEIDLSEIGWVNKEKYSVQKENELKSPFPEMTNIPLCSFSSSLSQQIEPCSLPEKDREERKDSTQSNASNNDLYRHLPSHRISPTEQQLKLLIERESRDIQNLFFALGALTFILALIFSVTAYRVMVNDSMHTRKNKKTDESFCAAYGTRRNLWGSFNKFVLMLSRCFTNFRFSKKEMIKDTMTVTADPVLAPKKSDQDYYNGNMPKSTFDKFVNVSLKRFICRYMQGIPSSKIDIKKVNSLCKSKTEAIESIWRTGDTFYDHIHTYRKSSCSISKLQPILRTNSADSISRNSSQGSIYDSDSSITPIGKKMKKMRDEDNAFIEMKIQEIAVISVKEDTEKLNIDTKQLNECSLPQCNVMLSFQKDSNDNSKESISVPKKERSFVNEKLNEFIDSSEVLLDKELKDIVEEDLSDSGRVCDEKMEPKRLFSEEFFDEKAFQKDSMTIEKPQPISKDFNPMKRIKTNTQEIKVYDAPLSKEEKEPKDPTTKGDSQRIHHKLNDSPSNEGKTLVLETGETDRGFEKLSSNQIHHNKNEGFSNKHKTPVLGNHQNNRLEEDNVGIITRGYFKQFAPESSKSEKIKIESLQSRPNMKTEEREKRKSLSKTAIEIDNIVLAAVQKEKEAKMHSSSHTTIDQIEQKKDTNNNPDREQQNDDHKIQKDLKKIALSDDVKIYPEDKNFERKIDIGNKDSIAMKSLYDAGKVPTFFFNDCNAKSINLELVHQSNQRKLFSKNKVRNTKQRKCNLEQNFGNRNNAGPMKPKDLFSSPIFQRAKLRKDQMNQSLENKESRNGEVHSIACKNFPDADFPHKKKDETPRHNTKSDHVPKHMSCSQLVEEWKQKRQNRTKNTDPNFKKLIPIYEPQKIITKKPNSPPSKALTSNESSLGREKNSEKAYCVPIGNVQEDGLIISNQNDFLKEFW